VKVKKYRAANYRDALAQVRNDLGPDAVILTTREVQRSRFLGLCRRSAVEIVAARDIRLRDERGAGASQRLAPPAARGGAGAGSMVSDVPRVPTPGELAAPTTLERIESRFDDMRATLEVMLQRQGRAQADAPLDLPRELAPFYDALRAQDVRADVAELVLAPLAEGVEGKHPEDVAGAVREAIAQRFPTTGPLDVRSGERRVVGLIGPTGVGKTTTIAKLAADFTFFRSKQVGLLTVDTYRVAAVEQLRTFAKIMTVPVKVAGSPEEANERLREMSRADLVLVDTAGRSQRNEDQVEALRRLLGTVDLDEIHLVLSATTKTGDQLDVIERFSGLGADRLVFTKLDETTSYGSLLNVVVDTELPVSYVTDGQMVPEDFEVADSQVLAQLLLSGRRQDA
jgi:flagellar biosynthesis protein FlhF